MLKKIFNEIIEYIKEEKFFLIGLAIFTIICLYPVDYYIITGGGTKDVAERVEVDTSNKAKGSFNMCYVHELKGTVATYLLSFIIPSWDRDKVANYKYEDSETLEDVEFRGDLDLKVSNSSAISWAYELADKKVEEVSTKFYVIATFDDYKTALKVQDQILTIDNQEFNDNDSYQKIFSKLKAGDYVDVKVIRDKKEKVLKCKLYELDGHVILGVYVEGYSKYKTTPKVEFKFKSSESGPSAGLITTLEIYNRLTKKDITNSLDIAGTGTIEADGTIGSIGGVKYKLMGAAKNKMDVFLVPAGENYKEALKVKKEKKLKIKIISVKNIKDALSSLEKLKKATA